MDLHNLHESLSVYDADVSHSSFTNVKLATSRFDNVDLKHSTFTNINLTGITFSDVNLTGASITNANLAGMKINGILVDDMLRAYPTREARTATPRAGAVLYAKDVRRLQRFYETVLGLTLEHEESDHSVLASPSFQLVIVAIPAHMASSIQIETPPRVRAESPTKLIFPTASIAKVRAAARDYGGDVLPAEREWDARDGRACDGNDPEGNVFQLREASA